MVKRFYKEVLVEKVEDNTGYKILCDKKPLKYGCNADLVLASKELAELVAKEWVEQPEEFDAARALPITNFVAAVKSLDKRARDKIISDLVSFIDTDLLFYRAQYPNNLVSRQDEKWTPLIIWANNLFDTSFLVTDNILPIKQNALTVAKIIDKIKEMDDFLLLSFFKLAALNTSLILGFSVIYGNTNAEEAFCLSRLEECSQNEMWGEDIEAKKAKELALNEARLMEKILIAAGYIDNKK